MKPEPTMTPEQALKVLEEITAQVNMNRATHTTVLKALTILGAKLVEGGKTAVVPPQAG